MNELNRATADDWSAIIEFPSTALDWTETDEHHFRKMLDSYCELGVDDEISGCTTLNQLSELKDSLEKLMNKHGLGFEDAIQRLDEEIAGREDAKDEDEDHFFGGSREIVRHEVMSDDEVSEMFSTLRESDTS